MQYIHRSFTEKNDRPGKPFEDYIASAGDTFVIADGVTRPAEEYADSTGDSPAARAALLTAECICRFLADAGDPTLAARDAVAAAAQALADYNRAAGLEIPAAAVFVACAVRDGRLHFSYLGDSLIFLMRQGVRIRLSEQQTGHLRVFGSTKGLHMTRKELLATITNNAAHKLGYGVVDGDKRCLDFLRAASIRLEPGDRVILSSDGMDKYIFYAPEADIARLTPAEMVAASRAYDAPPYNSYADDKAIITLDFA